MDKILVVEDEENIRSFIEINLTVNKFYVKEASCGAEAFKALESETFDIVVLDIMLPDISGFKICERIREEYPKIAVIMLTAKNQDIDKIMGLESGADDYMVKPFNPTELVWRIKALLRRIKGVEKEDSYILKIDELSLDKRAKKFFKKDREIKLTLKEMNIMELFMTNVGKAFSRDELLDKIWGENFYGDVKTVDVHIRRLREKVEDNPSKPEYIETLWGFGYRMREL
ncbi:MULTISPECIES: response regulator transcription factor [Clostridium]|uniref:Stage 0 sporulation protein A homolog n=1 Tax=Clostridium cadaveris TaxID=1529 RepID=A0A1I2LR41_9CLOT|nr:response regulator transcription factor [Clostridium cadaveris]MDU4951115.1 response regulator transcription factor [Clostridium sp.]MDM8310996.1 response regulator transcription factor [Clostridium cadaveris]MDY4948829.1 response regulator transcription factor [Clostridium cadaveris]NME63069.1 response regulator transcription factor [Clostridium cadaveris]NWK10052.1 response regulator transcription factor [Clostridium cadaveris]